MEIVSVTKHKGDLVFTGVDNKGVIKLGLLPLNKLGTKTKLEWFDAEIVNVK